LFRAGWCDIVAEARAGDECRSAGSPSLLSELNPLLVIPASTRKAGGAHPESQQEIDFRCSTTDLGRPSLEDHLGCGEASSFSIL
jgi:hypothetical protein